MNTRSVHVLMLSFIAISSVIAFKEYDGDFVIFDYKSDKCISQSGDQELCDEFQGCIQKIPKPVLEKFFLCFAKTLPEKSSLTDDEQKQFKIYKKCQLKVGHKCLGNQS
ncbi:uncharacterized protein TNCT_119711 [Trichonephila clavata]|uniref:Uncharacterized protein n=1 Tax=Trichonephila clavata TaxID=2740835 RepID=A0A8X6LVL0_TRICU|nr:uncharacterized protein TNCT_119711 [Trichonephila clavata]